MSIRTRLTLWYAGIMFVSLTLMGVLSYHEFVSDRATRSAGAAPQGGRGSPDEHGSPFEDVAASSSGAGCPRPCWRWAAAGG